MEKTAVFNLIILDESGSMSGCTTSTVAGCNSTIEVARSVQKKHADKQRSFISIYAFQSDGSRPSRYICKNEPVEKINFISAKDYDPEGCTPLLDAIGSTLVDLKAVAATHPDSMGIVTIITDGYENASTEYDLKTVKMLIEQHKELGWTFNFIGANIDVDSIGNALSIDNRMSFNNDNAGTAMMYDSFTDNLINEADRRITEEANLPYEEKIIRRKKAAGSFFKKR